MSIDDRIQTANSIQGRVGSIDPHADDFLPPNSMQVREVDGERVAVVRDGDNVYAIDNACPHQGYGLVTGTLTTDEAGTPLVTCLWHNWKFRATDGVCVLGEEDVACHTVDVDSHGTVGVTINRPSVEEQRAKLWPSLRSGLESNYVGQISRDSVRLLHAGATIEQVMAASVLATVERTEDGADHEIALAADCLSIAQERTGAEQVLPLVLGLAGLSEQTRGRSAVTASPVEAGDLVELIEQEDLERAMGRSATMSIEATRSACIEAASRHHLGYGHGAIYTQKVFEMLDGVGPDVGPVLIPQLVRSLTLMTREDLLPYMRRTAAAIADVDLEELASAPRTESVSPELVDEFLASDDPGIERAVELARGGIGVTGLIDLASLGSSQRMMRYDTRTEDRADDNFGWLQITHGLTHARATRWAWQNMPGAAVARMALHGIWLLFDTGRLERRSTTAASVWTEPGSEISSDPDAFANRLLDQAMNDQGGSFIVVAHLVKTIRAAAEESHATGSMLPLQASARLFHGPRRQRFVARNVAEAIRFVDTGRPPRR